MRKLLLFFSLFCSLLINGQTVTQYFKSAKHIDVNGKSYYFAFTKETNPRMLVPLCPFECDEYYIILTKKKAKNFLDILKRYQKKIDKWQNIANKEKVTNMQKSLGYGVYSSEILIPTYEFAYTVNNTLYKVALEKIGSDWSMIPEWFLEIDSKGECFVSIHSKIPTQTFYNNESIGTIDNTGGASITKKGISINPAGKYTMNKEDIQWLIEIIEELMEQLDESKKENKKSKLFY